MIEDHKYESKVIKVDSYPLQNFDDFSEVSQNVLKHHSFMIIVCKI